MKTKKFHLSDILTITTGRLVSERHMDGVYDILGFMTGESLFTHQLPRASKQCEPFLAAQFPALSSDAIKADIEVMCDALPEDRVLAQREITNWLRNAAAAHGEWFDVMPIPAGENGPRDPIEEAVELFGKDRVIVVQTQEGK